MNKLLDDGIIKTPPQAWTQEHVDTLLEMVDAGKSVEKIAAVLSRSVISVQIKKKRLTKTGDSYNDKHRAIKYASNDEYLRLVEPKSLLDVFAGNSFYKGRVANLVTNDTDPKFDTDYHMDAYKLLCKMYVDNRRFDVVDLDPYGSAIDCFPVALKIASHGIVITFGELGHKRWKRTDFVERWYGIDDHEQITTQNLIATLHRLAAQQKKKLECVHTDEFKNISRAYFILNNLKITKQWERPNARTDAQTGLFD